MIAEMVIFKIKIEYVKNGLSIYFSPQIFFLSLFLRKSAKKKHITTLRTQ
jgi:hypothetical protein